MDRLKTLGTWILLVIAFYIFSQVMIYLFLHKEKPAGDDISNNVVADEVINETNAPTSNAPTNRIEILN